MSNKPLTITQVVALPAGTDENPTWLNDGFTGSVLSVPPPKTSKKGKAYWPCRIGDPDGAGVVEMTVYTAPKFRTGDIIEVHGQGIKRTEFNGTAQVSIGQKSFIDVLGASVHHEEQVERQAESKPAMSGQAFPVPGPTVGMAINNALSILNQGLDHEGIVENLSRPSFWASVHEVASDVIRVARLLEAGKIAPSVKERASGQGMAPQPSAPAKTYAPHPAAAAAVAARRGQPGNDDQAANIDHSVNPEDTPF